MMQTFTLTGNFNTAGKKITVAQTIEIYTHSHITKKNKEKCAA